MSAEKPMVPKCSKVLIECIKVNNVGGVYADVDVKSVSDAQLILEAINKIKSDLETILNGACKLTKDYESALNDLLDKDK